MRCNELNKITPNAVDIFVYCNWLVFLETSEALESLRKQVIAFCFRVGILLYTADDVACYGNSLCHCPVVKRIILVKACGIYK